MLNRIGLTGILLVPKTGGEGDSPSTTPDHTVEPTGLTEPAPAVEVSEDT